MSKRQPTRPYFGPCRDPLCLWFVEWEDRRGVWRRYYANRAEARAALKAFKVDHSRLERRQ